MVITTNRRPTVQETVEAQHIVETQLLSEEELLNYINIVDVSVILKNQKMSVTFIKKHIFPLVIKHNRDDTTRKIYLDDVTKLQNIQVESLEE